MPNYDGIKEVMDKIEATKLIATIKGLLNDKGISATLPQIKNIITAIKRGHKTPLLPSKRSRLLFERELRTHFSEVQINTL